MSATPSASVEPTVAATPTTAPLPEGSVVEGVPADLVSSTTRLSFDTIGTDPGATPVLILETTDWIAVFDISTSRVTTTVPLPDVPQINEVEVTADGIWVTDHDNEAVLRLDAETGKTVARVELDGRSVSLTETEEGVWAGGGHVYPESVSLIDPASNKIARTLEEGAYPTYADGSLWFGRDAFRTGTVVRRVDPATGEVLARIKMVGAQQGCYVAGSFPDVVWSWCLELNIDTEPVRLDLETNTVAGAVELGTGGGLMGVADGFSWFEMEYSEEYPYPARLVRVDNATNQIDRIYENDRLVALAAGSLWTVDPDAGELRKIDLAQL
jgi:hypothetical protein